MYPGFPKQVMEAGEAELYMNAFMHYMGDAIGVRITPEYEEEKRRVLRERGYKRIIEIAELSEVEDLFRNLLGAKSSLSPADKDDLKALLLAFADRMAEFLPSLTAHKENLTFVTAALHEMEDKTAFKSAVASFTSATDILRLAAALNGGDTSLAEDTKFKKMPRGDRRVLLAAINAIGGGNAVEDMFRYKEQWIRLGEVLHPGEAVHQKRFPAAYEYFKAVRADDHGSTFRSKVAAAVSAKDVDRAVYLLKERPGELARRLDHLLRLSTDGGATVLATFSAVAAKVSTTVLLQVKNHFEAGGDRKSPHRAIFPKGNTAKVQVLPPQPSNLPAGSDTTIAGICRDTMVERFSKLPPLGKVFIDNEMCSMFVPFSQRSASRALQTIVRGSRIPLEPGKDTIRFFTWWHDLENGDRVDIDLSCSMYGDKWEDKGHVSYTNLRYGGGGDAKDSVAVHSGDITSAPDGACEYLDVNMPRIRKENGVRYLVMQLYSFTVQPFKDIPECCAGWMMRVNPGSGEIFEPKTVAQKFDLASEGQQNIPVIVDLLKREIIWCDLATNWSGGGGGRRRIMNVETTTSSTGLSCMAMAELRKPTVAELVGMHVEARGTLVGTPEEADLVVSTTGNLKPSDTERFMTEFL